VKLEEVLRIVKRFLYDEMRADYGTVRPIEAVLDENAARWNVTCEYQYSTTVSSSPETRIVELKIDNIAEKIESFRQVK